MKIYYAHCMSLYGSDQETRDLLMFEALGWEVENLNSPEHGKKYGKYGMPYFTDLARGCDALVFRANPDGSVPAGIATEVRDAITNQIPVFELPCGLLRRTLTVEQTREYLKEVGYR